MVRRQLAVIVFWQATTIAVAGIAAGIALGIAAGQAIWRAFAVSLGVCWSQSRTPGSSARSRPALSSP